MGENRKQLRNSNLFGVVNKPKFNYRAIVTSDIRTRGDETSNVGEHLNTALNTYTHIVGMYPLMYVYAS